MRDNEDNSWLSVDGAVVRVTKRQDINEALSVFTNDDTMPWHARLVLVVLVVVVKLVVEVVLMTFTTTPYSPNYRFRSTFSRTLQYLEPELLELPAVILIAVASTNEVRE